ncbi:MAG: cell division protein FtsZ [Methanomassiliicoccaceae archaeon]|nr:cell division protein FtsZ [Methanomassiliicoccaceae archaeon]
MEANTKETDRTVTIEPRIAVVGLGGAGCNVVSGFYKALAPVDTIAINTDKKALDETAADKKIYICKAVTKGEGTKGDARLGNKCAKAHEEEIEKMICGQDIVFLITGLGGGTGTGAASVVAEICNRNNIMTFTIGINPFSFETERVSIAREGIRSIRAACPNTYTIENDKVLDLMPDATLNEAMREVNKSIMGFVKGVSAKLVSVIEEEIASAQKIVYSKDIDISRIPETGLFSGINS